MKKILITGSNGFIGRYLYKDLMVDNRVVGIDIKNNITTETLIVDISNPEKLNESLVKHSPEIIIHTGAIKNLEECETNKSTSWRTNVNSTVKIAEYAKENNITSEDI